MTPVGPYEHTHDERISGRDPRRTDMYFSQLLAEERMRELRARAEGSHKVKEARRSVLRRRARIDHRELQAALADAVDLEAARRLRAAQAASDRRALAERQARGVAAAVAGNWSDHQSAAAEGWGGSAQTGLSA
jgi:hypothetical protein